MTIRKIEHLSMTATTSLGTGLAAAQLGTWIINAPYDRTFGVVVSAVLFVAIVVNFVSGTIRAARER